MFLQICWGFGGFVFGTFPISCRSLTRLHVQVPGRFCGKRCGRIAKAFAEGSRKPCAVLGSVIAFWPKTTRSDLRKTACLYKVNNREKHIVPASTCQRPTRVREYKIIQNKYKLQKLQKLQNTNYGIQIKYKIKSWIVLFHFFSSFLKQSKT